VTVRPERETLEASIVAHLREWADASQINYPDSQAQGEMRWWMRQAADYIAALAAAPDARCDCHLHDHQVCDVCQGVTVGLDAAPDARLAEALRVIVDMGDYTYKPHEFATIAQAALNAAAAREGTRSGGDTG
jgi:hypothetical protein